MLKVMGGLLALAVWGAPVPAQQKVDVGSRLFPDALTAGETTTLRITVHTDGLEPDSWHFPSPGSGISVIGSSDETQMSFSLPGGRSYTVRRTYRILALRPGRYRIPPVTVTVNGHSFTTAAHTLTVVPSSATAGARAGVREGVRFRVHLKPDTVYVGQQTTLEAEARFSGDLRSRMDWAPQFLPPNPSGFWIQDLKDGSKVRTRITGSAIVSEVHTYRRAYFPLSAGRFRLPPATLDYNLRSGFFGQSVPRQLTSDSLSLVVRPLPVTGRPASFDGAVGRYEIQAKLEPAHVSTGESATLTLTVSGVGNVKALPTPSLPAVSGAQVYAASSDATLTDDSGVVRGSKTFTWAIVPREPGRLSIGRLRYAVFDPATRRYRVLTSDPLMLRVSAGAPAPAAPSVPVGIGPLRTLPSGSAPFGWVRSVWFAALQGLPLLLALSLLTGDLRRRRQGRRKPSSRALRERRAEIARELQSAAAGADREFFVRVERGLLDWLVERLQLPALRSTDAAQVVAALRQAGVPSDLTQRVGELLGQAREARFAPDLADESERRAMVDALTLLMEDVDRRMSGRSAQPAARVPHVGLALVLALSAGAPASGPGRVDLPGVVGSGVMSKRPRGAVADFDAGVSAYQRRQFAQSRAAFDAYTAAYPDDPTGWYDLGLAAERSGSRGEAVWAWLKSLRLQPRDAQVRANLTAVSASPDLVDAATPVLPLSADEVWLLASFFWLLGSGLLIAYWRARTRTLLGTGVAALVIAALVVGSVVLQSSMSSPAVVVRGNAPLRVAPEVRAQVRAKLNEAAPLTVEDRRPGWLRVQVDDGTEGWVETRDARTY